MQFGTVGTIKLHFISCRIATMASKRKPLDDARRRVKEKLSAIDEQKDFIQNSVEQLTNGVIRVYRSVNNFSHWSAMCREDRVLFFWPNVHVKVHTNWTRFDNATRFFHFH
jgi:hypothetical protein